MAAMPFCSRNDCRWLRTTDSVTADWVFKSRFPVVGSVGLQSSVHSRPAVCCGYLRQLPGCPGAARLESDLDEVEIVLEDRIDEFVSADIDARSYRASEPALVR